jgi:hypothetical protein
MNPVAGRSMKYLPHERKKVLVDQLLYCRPASGYLR